MPFFSHFFDNSVNFSTLYDSFFLRRNTAMEKSPAMRRNGMVSPIGTGSGITPIPRKHRYCRIGNSTLWESCPSHEQRHVRRP